jgi:hypothetical protein
MNLIELPDTLAERVGCLIRPVLRPNHTLESRTEHDGLALQGRWQAVTSQLEGWKHNPDQLEDEGVVPPSRELVEAAEGVAEALSGHGVDRPDTLVTNGDGGIVMRWRLPGRTWSIELDADGSIESSLMARNRRFSTTSRLVSQSSCCSTNHNRSRSSGRQKASGITTIG